MNIADLTVLSRYREGEMRYDHVHDIMAEYGYHDFASQPEHFRFSRWLYIGTHSGPPTWRATDDASTSHF